MIMCPKCLEYYEENAGGTGVHQCRARFVPAPFQKNPYPPKANVPSQFQMNPSNESEIVTVLKELVEAVKLLPAAMRRQSYEGFEMQQLRDMNERQYRIIEELKRKEERRGI